jgi:type I restriction enzyme, S subunit
VIAPRRVLLEELATNIVDGPFGSNLKTSDYVIEGIPVLQGKNITNNRFVWTDIRYVSLEKAEDLKRSKVFVGDHLVIKIGSIGYSAVVDDLHGHTSAIIPANMAKITPNIDRVDSRYLHHWLVSKEATRYFKRVASKTAQPALSLTKIRELEVPCPALPEQRRIAAILDKADALRAKRREAIAKLDQLLQSVFLDMFGDPVTNPKGWPLISLTQVGKWKSGATPSKSEPCYWNGSFPWVSPKDMKVSTILGAQDHISELVFKNTNLKRIEPGHLLIVVRGMILAHSFPTAINAVPIAINQDMKAIKPIEELDIVYLKAAVDSLKARILSVISTAGHGTRRLDTRDASEVMVPVPPIDLQHSYQAIAATSAKLLLESTDQLDSLNNMFLAIQKKAFAGTL